MKLSIRWQLVAIICAVIVISFAALMTIVKYVLVEDYAEIMRSNDVQLTYIIGRDINQSLESAFAVERMVASYPNLFAMPEQEQRILLQNLRKEERDYELLAIINMDGMQIARSLGKNGDRSNRSWFREFKETGKNVISTPYYSTSTKNLIITLVHGIYENGTPKGMVMADIDTQSVQDFIRSYNDNSECKIYLLDQTGTTIAQPKELGDGIFNYNTMERLNLMTDETGNIVSDSRGDPVLKKQSFSVPSGQLRVIRDALQGNVGSTVYEDQDGERYLCVYRPVNLPQSDEQWSLVFVRPYSSLTDAIQHLLHRAAVGSAMYPVSQEWTASVTSASLTVSFSIRHRPRPAELSPPTVSSPICRSFSAAASRRRSSGEVSAGSRMVNSP